MNNNHSPLSVRQFAKKPLALLFATLLMSSSPQLVLGSEADAARAFYDNPNYTYCDIKILAAYWKQSRFDSKIRAGEKLLRNEQYVVEDYLGSARAYAREHNVRCDFTDADNPAYTYQDAEALAKFWGRATPYDAKLKIGSMLENGENKLIKQALNDARQSGNNSGNNNPDMTAVNAFYETPNLTYCDARLLSAYWSQTPYESKIRAGHKILAGAYSLLEDYRRDARNYALEHNVRCTFADANNPDYSYQDAEKLAGYWGKSNVGDAKLKIASMLQSGHNKMVMQALRNAGNNS
ncbi:MAG: hypothetical protein ACPGSM_00590 [Thiolinea sp.]